MTELQMGLIGLGAAAVVGVFGYNKWQEYRQQKIAESVMQPQHDDVLLAKAAKVESDATLNPTPEVMPVQAEVRSEPEIRIEVPEGVPERVEPVFVDPYPTEPCDDMQMAEAMEKPLAATPEVKEQPPLAAVESTRTVAPAPIETNEMVREVEAGQIPAELLDPRLEYIVAMELVEPVSAIQILHSQRSVLQRLTKPVIWVGFNEKSREWQRLSPDIDLDIRRLRIGLPLVNRLGPVSEGDMAIFAHAMQALADELMAVADMPPSHVLDQAAEIDRFCAAVDLEIGLNLVSKGAAFPGTKIRALSEAAGMVLGADGLFTRYDDAGRAQFSLQNFESTPFTGDGLRSMTTHGLTFLLDVPRVDHGERVFMQMSEVAKRFADTLQGALVDDNRQPLSDSQLDHIRREFIGKPQATMLSFGLAAGSPQALRLFS